MAVTCPPQRTVRGDATHAAGAVLLVWDTRRRDDLLALPAIACVVGRAHAAFNEAPTAVRLWRGHGQARVRAWGWRMSSAAAQGTPQRRRLRPACSQPPALACVRIALGPTPARCAHLDSALGAARAFPAGTGAKRMLA